jgi:tRNA threonylcarbamoyladenosine biosynthesis protein TsaE
MESETIHVLSEGWQDTWRIGRKLSGMLQSGDVVTLRGDLGSGKTVLTKGICEGLNVKEPVTSPTFTIVQEYSGRLPVYHFDFYRMHDVAEVAALDIDYYLSRPGISIIEWAERADSLFNPDRFEIVFTWVKSGKILEEDRRYLNITAPVNRNIRQLNL